MWNSNALWSVAHQLVLAQAEAPAEVPTEGQGGPQGGGGSSMLIFFVAMAAIMYFFLFRPQQKREKERREMLSALSKGDEVLTSGGIMGTIIGLNEKSVVLRVSDEPVVKMEFARGAVSRVITGGDSDGSDSDKE